MDNIEMLAAINLLAQQMEHSPDDLHEIHLEKDQDPRFRMGNHLSIL